MKRARLDDMTKGWFVGGFDPAALRTDACEVAVKRYRAGTEEAAHVHRVAVEVTLILEGEVEMAGERCCSDDILVVEPGDPSSFRALTDAVLVVVKMPSVAGDKYEV